MGINYYIECLVSYGPDIKQVERQCHVGRNKTLNLSDFCLFLKRMSKTKEDKKYLKSLVLSARANELEKNHSGNGVVEHLIVIYEKVMSNCYYLRFVDEYYKDHDFRDFIRDCLWIDQGVNKLNYLCDEEFS